MVNVLQKFSPKSELVVEGVGHIFKASEGVLRERIEPIIGGSLEYESEHPIEKEVIVNVNRYLVLTLAEMSDKVGGSRVVIESGHHKFFSRNRVW